jgi:TorA maturation chaperone TorD
VTGAAAISSDQAAELSSAAWLMARWWSRPLAEERELWDAAWEEAHELSRRLGADPALVDELARAAHGADPEALLDEYERLFVGPGHAPCSPYESLWRSDGPRLERGTLMGAAASELVQLYRALELGVRADAHELPDHVAVECEALAHAFGIGTREARGLARTLLERHLATWLPALCAVVEAETGEAFYRALARLAPVWTAALAAAPQ